MTGDAFFTTADGCRLAYEVAGEGRPVLFQHGLGATRDQPAEVFPAKPGLRRITLECRGHGRSELGDPARLTIAQLAADARALLAHLGVERAVVGGISMGAAIAMRLAVLHPALVQGLVLARPAWVEGVSPSMAIHLEVAELLRLHGPEEGARRFEASSALAAVERASPDNARSLRGFFTRPEPRSTVELLSRISADAPGVPLGQLSRLHVPALVIVNDHDAVHPVAYGERLRDAIPGARLRTVTSKSIDKAAYVAEFRQALGEFLAGVPA